MSNKISRFLWKAAICFFGSTFFFVVLFRFMPVPVTPLMLIRSVEQVLAGQELRLKHSWVSMDAISKNLALAVICSEDQNFMNHFGVDIKAIERSVEASKKRGRRLRGASTISQQTAKNVFLWPGRSWIRKGLEVYFTILIEIVWSKQRILEVYLNSIEMGNGIYGAQAASRHYFQKDARNLSKTQAAAIAAVLPNPREYSANPPSPYIKGRIHWILGQMGQLGELNL
ncbi:monofunctional biosynthetic peptidoglycan transglycosylase [Desulfopila sp. IMCC35006]|uniref:monofunctional biosynthetic peptidoglycan transglycosylase n=1 Tax=Desulfopila sp. IMCC35006 TaxID=2569542 RepID=UPI0010AD49CD|nr:monofunctional biosynthetic peptidoglycan transglycosylase [Desulfopila sp. IMCC35006]TKB26894.1 monofunctional biosynthetic peptidoglycan transglycosylase [Desulfopila sp. IMCC35006]